jgi:hypothetical protein
MQLFAALIAVTGQDVQARMDADIEAGKPLVAHVFVALADNAHQGIVPTSNRSLGDGQNANTNLYWGARYGLKSYFRAEGWRVVTRTEHPAEDVLERIVFARKVRRGNRDVEVQVIADAWDGRSIQKTIEAFLSPSDAPHVVAYVGHNGLMEFSVPEQAETARRSQSAIVLACASKPYFEAKLERAGAHPLLLTTNLMAPEAYTLHAALLAWFSGETSATVHGAAAGAYARYQKVSVRTSKRLFSSAP